MRMFSIENVPFYAAKFGPTDRLVVIGGLKSDENCHVYRPDGDIIEGLYVCGNIQGNRMAVEYPITVCGLSLSMGMTHGKIAAENAIAGI